MLGILELLSQDLQVAVEFADLSRRNRLEGRTIVQIEANLLDISSDVIKSDDRRGVFMVAAVLNIFRSHEILREPLEHFWMGFFDLRGYLKAINDEGLASGA